MSGLVGVKIGDINTYDELGLILLANLKNDTPNLKEMRVDVPGADGSLNLSYALTDGTPRYSDRSISFSLFAPVSTSELETKRTLICAYCHGKERKLILPTDSEHYYHALFAVGEISGYGNGTIPVKVIAEPYKYKNEVTEVVTTIGGDGAIDVVLNNEMRRITPSFTSDSDGVRIIFKDTQYTMNAGTITFSGLLLDSGENNLTIEGAPGSVITVRYQEATI